MKSKRFTKEFEEEAVRLYRTSGWTKREIADDLGVGLSTLTRWLSRSRDRKMDDPDQRPSNADVAAELVPIREHLESAESVVIHSTAIQFTGHRRGGPPRTAVATTAESFAIRVT